MDIPTMPRTLGESPDSGVAASGFIINWVNDTGMDVGLRTLYVRRGNITLYITCGVEISR
jgi:hypothetical protein